MNFSFLEAQSKWQFCSNFKMVCHSIPPNITSPSLSLSLSLSLSHTHTHTQSERECLVLWALQWRLLRNSQSTSAGASRTFAAMKKWWLPLEIRIHSKATQLFSISSKHQRSLSLSLSLSISLSMKILSL